VARANSKAARKTPKHVTTLIQLHRRLRAGMANVRAGTPVSPHIFERGHVIEKVLMTCDVNPRHVTTENLWIFGGNRAE
jgi:hypothetical protein